MVSKVADKESQDSNLVGIRSCENVNDNMKESFFCTVTSMVGRLKFASEMVGSWIEMEESRLGDSFSFGWDQGWPFGVVVR